MYFSSKNLLPLLLLSFLLPAISLSAQDATVTESELPGLETKSGSGIKAQYQAFDDWNIALQPGLYEGLLWVSKKETTAMPRVH
jgi:hypothetical protein